LQEVAGSCRKLQEVADSWKKVQNFNIPQLSFNYPQLSATIRNYPQLFYKGQKNK
jgi:hypothetical protein